MAYEAGLVLSGPMTQLEAEIWIRDMEKHFGSNLISKKYEVPHALQYLTQSVAIWWKMHHAIQGFNRVESWEEFKKTLLRSRLIHKHRDNTMKKPCACKICGEKGHFFEDCTKESQDYLGDFPIEKVELVPHEIEGLIRTSKSRKRETEDIPRTTLFLQRRTMVISCVLGARN